MEVEERVRRGGGEDEEGRNGEGKDITHSSTHQPMNPPTYTPVLQPWWEAALPPLVHAHTGAPKQPSTIAMSIQDEEGVKRGRSEEKTRRQKRGESEAEARE